jgi:hypothetical protein
MHQTMTNQAVIGQTWSNQPAFWAGLDERREMLNTQIPTRALQGKTPVEAYPVAAHSGRATDLSGKRTCSIWIGFTAIWRKKGGFDRCVPMDTSSWEGITIPWDDVMRAAPLRSPSSRKP